MFPFENDWGKWYHCFDYRGYGVILSNTSLYDLIFDFNSYCVLRRLIVTERLPVTVGAVMTVLHRIQDQREH